MLETAGNQDKSNPDFSQEFSKQELSTLTLQANGSVRQSSAEPHHAYRKTPQYPVKVLPGSSGTFEHGIKHDGTHY